MNDSIGTIDIQAKNSENVKAGVILPMIDIQRVKASELLPELQHTKQGSRSKSTLRTKLDSSFI